MITLLQIIIFIGYLYYIYSRFGVLESISDSTYYLKDNRRALFTGFCWGLGLLNLFQGLGMYGALSAGLLLFTGVTITHRTNHAHTRTVHLIAASTAIAITMAGLILVEGIVWIALPTILTMVLARNEDTFIWWVEVVAFTSIIIGYLLK